MQQSLSQHIEKVKLAHLRKSLTAISPGVDIAYESGRRIGVLQGMDQLHTEIMAFETAEADSDKDL